MRSLQWSLLIIISVFTVACNDSNKSPTPLNSISGKVMDDPMQNAKVCLDCNGNWSCDENEPFTYTGNEGEYELTGLNTEQIAHCPRLSEIDENTIDQITGTNIQVPFKLISSPNCNIITPITSLVQHQMEFGDSYQVAEHKIQQLTGNDLPTCSDYMQMLSSNTSLDKAFDMREMANVNAGLLQLSIQNIKEWESFESTSSQEMYSYLLHNVKKAMPIILDDLEQVKMRRQEDIQPQQVAQTAVGFTDNFGSDFFQKARASFSKSEKATQIDIEARDIEEEMAIMEAMRSAKPVNMVYQYGRNGTFFSPLSIDTLGFVSYQDYLKEDSYSLSYTREVAKRYNRDYYHSPIRVFNSRYVWSDGNFEEDNTNASPRIAHAGGRRGELITDVHLLQTTKKSGKNWRTITTRDVLNDYSSVQNTTEGRRRLPYRSEGHIAGLTNTSTAAVRTKSTAKWYDVSGKKISSLMNLQNNLSLWNKAIDPEARFEQGTKAFILNKEAASSSLNYEKQSSEGTVKSGEPISVLRPIFVANIYHPIESRYVNTYRFQRINSPNLQPRNLTTAAHDQLRDLLIISEDDVNYTAAFFRVNYVYQFERWNQPRVVELLLIPKDPNYTATFADRGEGRYSFGVYRYGGTYDDNFAYPENYWHMRRAGTTEVLTFNLNIAESINSTSKRQGLFNFNGRLILGTDFQIVNRGDSIEIDQFNLDSAGHQAVLNAIIPNRIEEQVEARENLK